MIDAMEKLVLEREVFGQGLEDQRGFGDRAVHVVVIGAERYVVGQSFGLGDRLGVGQALARLGEVARQHRDVTSAAGEHRGGTAAHRAVGSENDYLVVFSAQFRDLPFRPRAVRPDRPRIRRGKLCKTPTAKAEPLRPSQISSAPPDMPTRVVASDSGSRHGIMVWFRARSVSRSLGGILAPAPRRVTLEDMEVAVRKRAGRRLT